MTTERPQPIQSSAAPEPVGPYSQAVAAGDFVFLAGQIPLDPSTGALVTGSIEAQTERVMANLASVLTAAGLDFSAVVKTTIFLMDLADFAAVNGVYGRHMGANRPARSTVAVAGLPKGASVEVEMVAYRGGAR